MPAQDLSSAKAGAKYPRLARFSLISALFLTISLALTIGTCMAVLNGNGSLSDLRSVFSALIPSRAGGGSCH